MIGRLHGSRGREGLATRLRSGIHYRHRANVAETRVETSEEEVSKFQRNKKESLVG